jgi:hypothetical protein
MDRIPERSVSSRFRVTEQISAHKVSSGDYMDAFIGKSSLRIRIKGIIPIEQTDPHIWVL